MSEELIINKNTDEHRAPKEEIANLNTKLDLLSEKLTSLVESTKQNSAKLDSLTEKLSFQADQLTILRIYGHTDVAQSGYAVDPFPVGPTGTQMIKPRSRYRRLSYWSR